MISLRKCRCHYAPCSSSDMQLPQLPHSQPDALPLSFRARADAGIARRGGRSPSAARKLPQQKPRSPRRMVKDGKPLGANPWEWGYTTSPAGSSGGSAEGASEGRQPLTGPHLPPPEAAQAKRIKSHRARRAQQPPLKGQPLPFSPRSASAANLITTSPARGGPNNRKVKPPCPQGIQTISRRTSPAF